jgi:hypothetical protein
MKIETNGWGDSMVATKYVYQRIHSILDLDNAEDAYYHLSRFMKELAMNYKVDTGNLIGEKNESND